VPPDSHDPAKDLPTEPVSSGTGDELDRLRRLADLHREGVLSDDEFAAKKQEILNPATPRRPRRRLGRKAKIAAVALTLVLIGGGATAAAVKTHHDGQVRKERKQRAEARARAEVKAARAREARRRAAAEAKRATDQIEITLRRSIVNDLRKSVTKDFEDRVASGVLDGPILHTSCDPISGGAKDLEETTGKYQCLVATEKLGGGRERGYPVDATINYTKGSYTWQLSS
jgi:hypothetical protein